MAIESNSEKLARLEALLAAGTTSTRAGDLSATFDLDAIRKQIRDLRAQDPVARRRRPVCSQIKLN
jgi:chromosome segregation and condensation protein ScpB